MVQFFGLCVCVTAMVMNFLGKKSKGHGGHGGHEGGGADDKKTGSGMGEEDTDSLLKEEYRDEEVGDVEMQKR